MAKTPNFQMNKINLNKARSGAASGKSSLGKNNIKSANQNQAVGSFKERRAKRKESKEKAIIREAQETAKTLAKGGFFYLLFQIRPFSDWMYGIAIFAAMLKDILDLIELTGIGYIVVLIVTFLCSIFIGMMMLLGSLSTGKGRFYQKTIKKFFTLIIGLIAELIPIIGLLPIETAVIIIIYVMVLGERIQAKEQEKQERILANQEYDEGEESAYGY